MLVLRRQRFVDQSSGTAMCKLLTIKRLTITVPMLLACMCVRSRAQNASAAAAQAAPPLPAVTPPDLPSVVPAGSLLTLHQAVQTALKDNPQITAARYSVLSAH